MCNHVLLYVQKLLLLLICFFLILDSSVFAYADMIEISEQAEETPSVKVEETKNDEFRCNRYFPPFFQEDYPDVLYGSGTVSDNGCSITAMAIVATYLTGHEYYPDELARYFGGRAENNIARLEMAADALKLDWKRAVNFHYVVGALRRGQIVIELVNSKSIFTESQHFVILTKITDDDKILVIDPSSRNNDNWYIKQNIETGFPVSDLLTGYDGAWIFTPNYDSESTFVYYEEPLDTSNPRYPDIKLKADEIRLLAKLVWVEARGESDEGQQAVAEIVLNRMAAEDFPNSLQSVVYGQGQFVTDQFDKATPSQAQYDAIERALYGPYILPPEVVYYARSPHNDNIWGRIGGHIFCYRAE